MLADPIVIGTPAETSDATPAAGLSLPIVGDRVSDRIVREVSDGTNITRLVSSLVNTKENKPFGTKRVKLRLERPYFDGGSSLIPLLGFVEVTFGLPKDGHANSVTHLSALRGYLGQLLLFGDGLTAANLANGNALFARIVNGEL
jgi:hypothetical protein